MKSTAIFFSLFLCLGLFGCASSQLKKFSNLKPGMYKGDVLDSVGSPVESRYRGDQYIWTYKFLEEDRWVVKEVHVKNDFVTYAGEPVPGGSDSKISRVVSGMSKSQVLDVAGFPKKTEKRGGKDSWVYAQKTGGDALVQFEEDKVTFIGPSEVVPVDGPKEDGKFEPVE